MMRRQLLLSVTVAMAIAGGGVAFAVSVSNGDSTIKVASPTAAVSSPRTVRMQELKNDATSAEQTYTGIVRARYETDLAFRVGGKIISRQVEIGQRVKAGAVLFRMDPTDYRLAVKAAEADLDAAEAEVVQSRAEDERIGRLQNSGAASTSEVDKNRSARDVAIGHRSRAKENLTLARNRLEYCTLSADADGVIVTLPAEAGQVVAEGQIVARIAREGDREAVVNLPENQAELARTARAAVSFWSIQGESFLAILRELSPTADPITRTYQARFTIPNPSPRIVLGMTATVHLQSAVNAPGFTLPLSSLHRLGDQPAVWIVDRATGSITLTPVVVREYRHETVILSSGVKPGQWVVTAGVQKLDAGLTVRPWEDK